MAETSRLTLVRERLHSEFAGLLAWFGASWRGKRWFRVLTILAVAFVLALTAGWIALTRNLPDADSLLHYETPLPTMVRGADGNIVYSYARERRVQLQYQDFPPKLIEAFISAEDKTFFTHGGVDIFGTLGAVFDYVRKFGTHQRAVGGSTITQQVAKNLLLGDQYSVSRKLKEMVLAHRIEGVLTKEQIITLYLNEIALGRRSFGVQAAARAYFDKDVGDLNLDQMAFLAILPKAPEKYGRKRFYQEAVARRNFVLDQMRKNGFISRGTENVEAAKPITLATQQTEHYADAGYFIEDVRRQLIAKYGQTADDGPNSVYAGGLWVRTSLDTKLQDAARDALRAGLMRYAAGKIWRKPVAYLDPSKGSLTDQLRGSNLGINYKDWRIGVVTKRSGSSATIGFSDGKTYPLSGLPDALKVGDVTAVAKSGSGYAVRTVPEVSGAILLEDPETGRIKAMQGGFDSRLGSFNRATQAERQPGSTIKPFVYATALDHGMTPATEVPDTPYCVYQGAALGDKCFRNFANEGGGGVHTMRWGLEQSRNLMTVHIAADIGMPNVINTFKRMGIGDYKPYLSFALGAGDTTVQRMVAGYTAFANWGRKHGEGTVIDYVQDRHGKVIWRADNRPCTGCNMPEWDGKPMPRLGVWGQQVMDPRTAFQVVHMLQGVVQRGTAIRLRSLDLPIFGKTGTTSGPTNAWFVGGSPDLIAGMYVGFDQPRNLGGWVQGGNTAAPIFKYLVEATKDRWTSEDFVAPPGIRMVKIDRVTGKKVFEGTPSDDIKAAVIWEAFKPDTAPPRGTRQDQIAARREEILDLIRRAEEGQRNQNTNDSGAPGDFVEEQGGIY